MSGEVPPFVPREPHGEGEPRYPSVFTQAQQAEQQNQEQEQDQQNRELGMQMALRAFLERPIPVSEDETKRFIDDAVELVRRNVAERNLGYELQLQTSAAAQDAVTEMLLLQNQQQAAYNEVIERMTTTDARVPQNRSDVYSGIAHLTQLGLPPTITGELTKRWTEAVDTQQLTERHTKTLDEKLREYREEGGLSRALAATREGLTAGATLGMAEARPLLQRVGEDVGGMVTGLAKEAFPDRFPRNPLDHPFQSISHPFAEAMQAQKRAGPAVDFDVYRDVMGRTLSRRLKEIEGDVGMYETDLEQILTGAGHFAGMALPFNWLMRGGAAAGQAATGLARWVGMAAKAGIEKRVAEGFGKTIMELGLAGTRTGAMLQKVGGIGTVLFGAGASHIPAAEEERIAKLPSEFRDEARRAARITSGTRMVATAPLYVLAGRLGHKVKGGVFGQSIATGGAFSLMGQGLEAAEKGIRQGLAELSPEFRRKLELRIVADPELQGPIARMARTEGPGDPEFGKALGDFMKEWTGNALGAGMLHALGMFGRPSKGDRRAFDAMVQNARFLELDRIEQSSESDSAVVKAAMASSVFSLFRSAWPSRW